ncbi:MAG: DNA repair protein RadA [Planctomycetota bacterium]
MSKGRVYRCKFCGSKYIKWQGRCSECNNWDCLEETIEAYEGERKNIPPPKVVRWDEVLSARHERIVTGFKEVDRVLGGGFVEGCVVLLAGDPGVGKSTLVLHIALNLVKEGKKILYICAEESPEQIHTRLCRLTKNIPSTHNLLFAQECYVTNVITLAEEHNPALLIIDSIQMLISSQLESSPGCVAQVRECARELIEWIKKTKTILILIGHITKDGFIAGPKILEHIADVVLYFESQMSGTFRLLRSIKNRFGLVPESALFDIRAEGIIEIENPSTLFSREIKEDVCGSAKFPMILGTRPVITEVQTLLTKTIYPAPVRRSSGVNITKLQILIALLEKKMGIYFSNYDVYLNIVGGLYIDDPAVDLPIVVSLLSVVKNKTISYDAVFFGEIDLLGYLRPVNLSLLRVNEAIRQNCLSIYMPSINYKEISKEFNTDMNKYKITGLSHIKEIIDILGK